MKLITALKLTRDLIFDLADTVYLLMIAVLFCLMVPIITEVINDPVFLKLMEDYFKL